MKRYLLSLLCFVIPSTGFAGGVISPTMEIGLSGGYHSTGLKINLWSDTSGGYGGVAYNAMSSDHAHSHDTSANVGYLFENDIDISIDYYQNRDLPIDLDSTSFSTTIPLSLVTNHLQNTAVLFSAGKTRYQSNTAKKRELNRRDYSVGLTHTFFPQWIIGISHTWHHNEENLARTKLLIAKQKIRNESILSTLLSLYDSSWDTWGSIDLSTRTQIGLSYTKANNLFAHSTQIYGFNHQFQATDTIGFSTSLSHIDDGNSKDWYAGLSMNFYF